MSIENEIGKLVLGGKLHALTPAVSNHSKLTRGVFVSPEVWGLVGDEVPVAEELERVSGQARARLDSFSFGKSIVLALNPKNKSVHTDIARNAPIDIGVVDVRITNPKPQLRIFGCFAKKDILILLTWKMRKDLEGKAFDKEVQRSRSEMSALFPAYPPLVGLTHDDYISKPYIAG